MAVGPVGRSAEDEGRRDQHGQPDQPEHASGRHRKAASKGDGGPIAVERLFAVETAYLVVFTGALVLALRFPAAAVALCGISGVTARTASREAARLAALLWDRTHHTRPTTTDRARHHVRVQTRTRVHVHEHARQRPGHRARLH